VGEITEPSAAIAQARRAGDAPAELVRELAEADAALCGAPPGEILRWAYDRFGDGLVVTSSFQDCVLADLANAARPGAAIVFLDTGFHFPETLAYLHHVEKVLNLTVEIVRPALGDDEHPCGTSRCCELRKVAPLQGVLSGRTCWVTGVKRVDTPERAGAAAVAWDAGKGVVKVNPLVAWSEDDVEDYIERRQLPRHPLTYVGYASIGCAPVTTPVADGDDPRAGRWSGSTRTECGLHL
jgi:phosphoadenosine phosphosulfate reductase